MACFPFQLEIGPRPGELLVALCPEVEQSRTADHLEHPYLGAPDLAVMEVIQYSSSWHDLHMAQLLNEHLHAQNLRDCALAEAAGVLGHGVWATGASVEGALDAARLKGRARADDCDGECRMVRKDGVLSQEV